ncbi:interleukin-15 [Carettochelys insculpta]|uniref:interleukin-15 n=1 Tax=Carettochelys insculpta TaxID=44489 RepID=UPI003EB89FEC
MLVLAWPQWNSDGAWHCLGTQKTHLRRIHLHYQQYLILRRHFLSVSNNATGITIFVLCCISAYLPRTEAENRTWQAVIDDLRIIKGKQESIDASLYAAYSEMPDECEVQVMECFFLELNVIFHECKIRKGCKIQQYVYNVLANVKESLLKNKSLQNSLSMSKIVCKQCEEYEESSFSEFIKNFEAFAQRKLKY